MELRTVPLSDVQVGPRLRGEDGPLLNLICSIEKVGLLHPVVLNSRLELVAGGRRLAAVRRLGWTEVPAVIVTTLDEAAVALRAELEENTCREPLTPTEIVRRGRELEMIERPEAFERERSGRNQHTEPSGKLPGGSTGRVREKVASALNIGARTYEKAKHVVDAAESDPERFGHLPEVMDSQSVDAAYRQLRPKPDPTPVPVYSEEDRRQAMKVLLASRVEHRADGLWIVIPPEESGIVLAYFGHHPSERTA